MTAIATKPRTEPVEAEDPRNALLDAFANQVQALIDNGLEVQIRARLAHLLPAPVLPPPVAPGRLPERESGATSKTPPLPPPSYGLGMLDAADRRWFQENDQRFCSAFARGLLPDLNEGSTT